MKLLRVKFRNSMKVGSEELLFATNDKYDLTIGPNEFASAIVTITDKLSSEPAHCDLSNVIWWVEAPQPAAPTLKDVTIVKFNPPPAKKAKR